MRDNFDHALVIANHLLQQVGPYEAPVDDDLGPLDIVLAWRLCQSTRIDFESLNEHYDYPTFPTLHKVPKHLKEHILYLADSAIDGFEEQRRYEKLRVCKSGLVALRNTIAQHMWDYVEAFDKEALDQEIKAAIHVEEEEV